MGTRDSARSTAVRAGACAADCSAATMSGKRICATEGMLLFRKQKSPRTFPETDSDRAILCASANAGAAQDLDETDKLTKSVVSMTALAATTGVCSTRIVWIGSHLAQAT